MQCNSTESSPLPPAATMLTCTQLDSAEMASAARPCAAAAAEPTSLTAEAAAAAASAAIKRQGSMQPAITVSIFPLLLVDVVGAVEVVGVVGSVGGTAEAASEGFCGATSDGGASLQPRVIARMILHNDGEYIRAT